MTIHRPERTPTESAYTQAPNHGSAPHSSLSEAITKAEHARSALLHETHGPIDAARDVEEARAGRDEELLR